MSKFFSTLVVVVLVLGAIALQGFTLAYGGVVEESITNFIGWGSLVLAFFAGAVVTATGLGVSKPTLACETERPR
ncbi:hypothetical protein [Pseudomonas baetica]|uniref:hypothetical protein n=1 Tax=Pseudomonas baetica TaxID=674054 RepID=UPI002404AF16|nr:hypothetical protein [Pseudomonas baetica]MDF9779098.1 hypothetical protein [Pseudomonas baetica]